MTFEMTRDEFANEFVSRVWAAVDDLALVLAHTPHDRQDAAMRSFIDSVRPQWIALFSAVLSPEDVDGMVADVLARFRAKRNDLEKLEVGSA